MEYFHHGTGIIYIFCLSAESVQHHKNFLLIFMSGSLFSSDSHVIFTLVIVIFNFKCHYLLMMLTLSCLATVAMVTPGKDHNHHNLITS